MTKPALPILLVEDNAVNQLAMEALLDRLGYRCETARGGREAIEAFRTGAHSLVLMDLMMPHMDGFQAALSLRALEFGTGRRTPIVAITAYDPVLVRDRCLAAGIDDIQAKPVEIQSLAAKLSLWTGGSSSATPEVNPSPPKAGDARNGEAILSKKVLGTIYGSENMQRIVNTFLTVTERMLSELEVAIRAEDDDLIRTTLHELKSATLEVRAQEMARLCFELEVAARKSDRTEMVAIYAALSHAFVRVKALDGYARGGAVDDAPIDPARADGA